MVLQSQAPVSTRLLLEISSLYYKLSSWLYGGWWPLRLYCHTGTGGTGYVSIPISHSCSHCPIPSPSCLTINKEFAYSFQRFHVIS